MQECAFALALPVFRKLLPKEGMAFLDQKCPKSMEELMDTLQQWWAIVRGRPSDEVSTLSDSPLYSVSAAERWATGLLNVEQGLPCLPITLHQLLPHPQPGRTAVCGRGSAAARRGTSHQLAQTEPEDAGLLPQRQLLPTN